jgi:hypothetical protein
MVTYKAEFTMYETVTSSELYDALPCIHLVGLLADFVT